jgi:hypothetical protein
MSRDILYFNHMTSAHTNRSGPCYIIPFSMTPETQEQANIGDIVPIRQRIRAVLVTNGYVLIEVLWKTKCLIVRKK